MKLKALKREQIESFKKERQGLEVDIMNEVLSSRRTAWRVATVSIIAGIVGFGVAATVIHKYSQPMPPFLLTYNSADHDIQQIKMTRDQESYGQALDTMFLTRYVLARESYDFNSVQADYDAVGLMSTPNVADSYLTKFRGRNSIVKQLGDSEVTRTYINSVILDREHSVATIRFTTIRRVRSNPVDDPPRHWIAVMGYTYQALPMNATQRQINPLGFRVTSYRVNPESN